MADVPNVFDINKITEKLKSKFEDDIWVEQSLRCIGCGTCEEVCPYGAIRPVEGKKVMQVMEALCKGCGSCASACPECAITMNHYTTEQIIAQGLPLMREEVK